MKRTDQPSKLITYTLLCAGLFGLMLSGAGFREVWSEYLREGAAQSWQQTIGVIETWNVEESYVDGVNYFYAYPTYVYQVGGSAYRGYPVRITDEREDEQTSSNGPEKPLEWLARFPIGEDVTVYFDPTTPTETSLNRERQLSLLRQVAVTIGMLFFASVAVLFVVTAEFSTTVSISLAALFMIGGLLVRTGYPRQSENIGPDTLVDVKQRIQSEFSYWDTLAGKNEETVEAHLGPANRELQGGSAGGIGTKRRILTYDKRPHWESKADIHLVRRGGEWRVESVVAPFLPKS